MNQDLDFAYTLSEALNVLKQYDSRYTLITYDEGAVVHIEIDNQSRITVVFFVESIDACYILQSKNSNLFHLQNEYCVEGLDYEYQPDNRINNLKLASFCIKINTTKRTIQQLDIVHSVLSGILYDYIFSQDQMYLYNDIRLRIEQKLVDLKKRQIELGYQL